MMPDDGRRVEGDPQAAILQPPANVYVVARRAEDRIESADRLERRPVKGHVAAGDVLGLAGRRRARGAVHRARWRPQFGHQSIALGREVRTSHSGPGALDGTNRRDR